MGRDGSGMQPEGTPKASGLWKGLLKASDLAFVGVCPHPSGEAELGQGLPSKQCPLTPTPQSPDPGGLRPPVPPHIALSPSPSLWDFSEQSRL